MPRIPLTPEAQARAKTLLDDPVRLAAILDDAFREGGMMASLVPGSFRERDEQAEFARSTGAGAGLAYNHVRAGDGARILLLEAGTGVGKTIPYLVVAGLYAVASRRQSVISTYTLALQRQIMGSDASLAAEMVFRLTGHRPTFAVRRGLGNFMAVSRVDDIVSDLLPLTKDDADAVQDLLTLRAFAHDPEQDGSIAAYLEQYGRLPAGIPEHAIRLHSRSETKDRARYDAEVAIAADADVVIVTHALLGVHLRYGNGFVGTPTLDEKGEPVPGSHRIGMVVVDEADRLPDAFAQGIEGFALRTLTETCTRLADTCADHGLPSDDMDGMRILAERMLSDCGAAYVGGERTAVPVSPQSIDPLTHASILQALKALSDGCHDGGALLRQMDANAARMTGTLRDTVEADIAALRRMADDARGILGNLTSPDRYTVMLSWSPTRAYPSLHLVETSPGIILSRLWRAKGDDAAVAKGDDAAVGDTGLALHPRAEFVMATSATLTDLTSDARGFSAFARSIGLRDTEPALLAHQCDSIEPADFGRLRFHVVNPKSMPQPSVSTTDLPAEKTRIAGEDDVVELDLDDKGYITNPKWLDLVAGAILEVSATPSRRPSRHKAGTETTGSGNILVLTNSFTDAEALEARLRDLLGDRLIVHRRGQRLQTLVKDVFLTRARACVESTDPAPAWPILITPGAWEGLNLPGIIDHLVITRMPLAAGNDVVDGIRMRAMTAPRRNGGTLSPEAAKRILFSERCRAMAAKLRQGIGRAVRTDDDMADVWFLDPRLIPNGSPSLAAAAHKAKLSPALIKIGRAAIPARFRGAYMDAEVHEFKAVKPPKKAKPVQRAKKKLLSSEAAE